MKKIVLASGGFDPVHSGHISYLAESRALGDELWVALNSDDWLVRKKGKPFMDFIERKTVLENLSMVDRVIAYNDDDDTACAAIFQALSTTSARIIFANGGDRNKGNIPEMAVFGDHPDVEFAFGSGGVDKKNSSSWILDQWKTQKTERSWGYWRVLDNKPESGIKVKELVINPGSELSDQRHQFRSEHWYVLDGELEMNTEYNGRKKFRKLTQFSSYIVDVGVWHRAVNSSDKPCHILEVQYGKNCIEEDIERRS